MPNKYNRVKPYPRRPLVERFWEKVIVRGEDECWEWQGKINLYGYGMIFVHDEIGTHRNQGAHRVALILSGVDIPDGYMACHHCDNRKCCNPRHLYPGTKQDNTRDMLERGRAVYGEKSSKANLTLVQVEDIKQEYALGRISQRKLAKRYGVHNSTISRILRGKRWPHVYKPIEKEWEGPLRTGINYSENSGYGIYSNREAS